jgi:hypothetical protein
MTFPEKLAGNGWRAFQDPLSGCLQFTAGSFTNITVPAIVTSKKPSV